MKTLKVLVAGSLLSLALVQVGFAGDKEHCDRHGKHARHHQTGAMKHHHNPMLRLLSKLELSEQQDQQIKQILEAEKPEMRTQRQAKIGLMHELHEVVSQSSFDDKKAEALASKIGDLAKASAMQKAKTGSKIYATLTPEQQQKFNQLFEEKKQKRAALKKPAHYLGVNQAEPTDGFQHI